MSLNITKSSLTSYALPVFDDIDTLLLIENEKFNSSKYLNKILLSLTNDENVDYLDLNSLIKKLKTYLENDITTKKYGLIIKQFYNVFIKLSALDNSKKNLVNEAIIKNLNNLVELVDKLEEGNDIFLQNQLIIKVLVRAYNTKFVFFVCNVISDLILSDLVENKKDISANCTNYEVSHTALNIIKDCNNILATDAIKYMDNNCKHIKADALKNLHIHIIRNKYINDIEIWQLIINTSKRDFILTVDRVMVDLISKTNLQLNNFNSIINSMLTNNQEMVEFEKFLIKDVKIAEITSNANNNTNKDDIEDTRVINVTRNISGLAYYKSIKFNENLKNRTLSFVYFGKVAKNLNKNASIQLNKNKKSELWQLIKERFNANKQISENKDFDVILKQFEIILNPNI